MTTTLVDWAEVTQGLIAALEAHFTPKSIEVGDHMVPVPTHPDDVPGKTRPVVWVARVPAGRRGLNRGWGGEELGSLVVRHQIRALAGSQHLASLTSAEAVNVILERDASGFVNPITLTGMSIINREFHTEIPVEVVGSFESGAQVDLWVQVT